MGTKTISRSSYMSAVPKLDALKPVCISGAFKDCQFSVDSTGSWSTVLPFANRGASLEDLEQNDLVLALAGGGELIIEKPAATTREGDGTVRGVSIGVHVSLHLLLNPPLRRPRDEGACFSRSDRWGFRKLVVRVPEQHDLALMRMARGTQHDVPF